MAKLQLATYRLRSVPFDAVQVDGTNMDQVVSWLKTLDDLDAGITPAVEGEIPTPENPYGVMAQPAFVWVETPAGDTLGAGVGDWVIHTHDGRVSTCRGEAFAVLYEPA